MSIHKTTHMRIHNDANMSFHKDRQSPPLIEATRAAQRFTTRAATECRHQKPLPPAAGAPCTTSQSPPCPGSTRRAHERRGQRHHAYTPTHADCPTFPAPPQARSPGTQEPLAANHNQCPQPSAVIIKANTNADNPTTRAVMFHLGTYIPQGVPDTYGFNGIDTSQCTGDTIALTYPSGISGLSSTVKLRWNGNGVEIIGNTGG
jgi:hypothetical protein